MLAPVILTQQKVRHFAIGIDLGKEVDHSALAVVERVTLPKPTDKRGGAEETEDHLHVIGLKRWELHTEYRQIVADVGGMVMRAGLQHATMTIDETGVGKPVVQLFIDAYNRGRLGTQHPRGVIIHGGADRTGRRVPKLQLVSTMLVLMQGNRLKFAADLALADLVTRELRAFTAKISPSGQTQFESARERDHDDLVLAVALACWACRRQPALAASF